MMPKRAGNICKLREEGREAETDRRTEERTDGRGGKREEGREST